MAYDGVLDPRRDILGFAKVSLHFKDPAEDQNCPIKN